MYYGKCIKAINQETKEEKYFPNCLSANKWLNCNHDGINTAFKRNKDSSNPPVINGWEIFEITLEEYNKIYLEDPDKCYIIEKTSRTHPTPTLNKIGLTIGPYFIEEALDKRSGVQYFKTKCIICGREDELNWTDIKICRNYNNDKYICPHQAIVQNFGINDIPDYDMSTEENKRIYKLWSHIIERCSDKNRKKYKTYSQDMVCEKWIRFSGFLDDIEKVEGFKEWLDAGKGSYHLDKDSKDPNNRIYSLETCIFLTPSESGKEVYNRKKDLYDNTKPLRAYWVKKKHGHRLKVFNLKTKETYYFLTRSEASFWLLGNVRRFEKYKDYNEFVINDYKIISITYDEYEEALKNAIDLKYFPAEKTYLEWEEQYKEK